jgi:nucleotide-binding universal stress UspA family protein
MIRTILVPLDGSELAESVLPYAEQIAGGTGSELVLLTSVYLSSAWEESPMREDLGKETVAAQAYLESKRDQLKSRGLSVRTVMAYQPEAESILNAAADEDADLIAMSTHGLSGISRWIFGSVADKVLHATHRPLLLVRAREAEERSPARIDSIVVPLDGSELSLSVLPYVEEVAEALGASLVLVHAVQPLDIYPGSEMTPTRVGTILDDLLAHGQSFLTRVAQEIEARGKVKVRSVVNIGVPVNEIVRIAQEVNAGLIGIATHGRSGIGRWMMGSVADAVVRRTNLPCLVIRPEEVQQTQQHD